MKPIDMTSRLPFLLMKWRRMGLKVNGRVLDLGCADASLSRFVEGGVEYVGVDFDAAILAKAHCNIRKRDFIRCDIGALPFRNCVFDVIFAISVLEHIPPKAFERIPPLMKPSGQLAIQIPNSRYVIELHTRIPFYYYLPLPLRNLLLSLKKIHTSSYDLRPAQVRLCLKHLHEEAFEAYKYPSSITHIPDVVGRLIPVSMGFLFLFTFPTTHLVSDE